LKGKSHYGFRLQHVSQGTNSRVLTASVSIQDGQKQIIEPQLNGQSLTTFESADFPSLEELFSLIKKAKQTGCWRVAAIYDPIKYFPTWCAIEMISTDMPPSPKQVDIYQITDFR
jgi:hypothetical protein